MHNLTGYATTTVARYVSKTGLSKCPNNFNVHYMSSLNSLKGNDSNHEKNNTKHILMSNSAKYRMDGKCR